jgi:hypothetical protein
MEKMHVVVFAAVLLTVMLVNFSVFFNEGGPKAALAVEPGGFCADCGSVSNCVNGNGLNSGYCFCWLGTDDSGRLRCYVSGWGCC